MTWEKILKAEVPLNPKAQQRKRIQPKPKGTKDPRKERPIDIKEERSEADPIAEHDKEMEEAELEEFPKEGPLEELESLKQNVENMDEWLKTAIRFSKRKAREAQQQGDEKEMEFYRELHEAAKEIELMAEWDSLWNFIEKYGPWDEEGLPDIPDYEDWKKE